MVDPHLEYRPIEVSDQVQELRVPKEHIGAVLGRGGKRINAVRMMSGCKVIFLLVLLFVVWPLTVLGQIIRDLKIFIR